MEQEETGGVEHGASEQNGKAILVVIVGPLTVKTQHVSRQ